MLTILGDLTEEVHGLRKACDGNQLCVISAMDDGNCSPGEVQHLV